MSTDELKQSPKPADQQGSRDRAGYKEFYLRCFAASRYVAVLCLGGTLLVYLFGPWIFDSAPEPIAPSASIDKGNPLDFYVVRDASESADGKDYDLVQRQVVSLVKEKVDRLAYARFGSTTLPETIDLPTTSASAAIAEVNKLSAPRGFSGMTNFPLLFKSLQNAIDAERGSSIWREPREHTDVIVIISDGVPDPDKKDWRCPSDFRKNGHAFISREIRDAFESLVKGSYSTKEELLVFLVLAGGDKACDQLVAAEWVSELGDLGLRVLVYDELGTDKSFEFELFGQAARDAGIFLIPSRPSLSEDERRRFDRGLPFAAPYKYFSRRSEGRAVVVERATLLRVSMDGERRERSLFALNDWLADPTNREERGARFYVEKPTDEQIRGPVGTTMLVFKAEPGLKESFIVSEFDTYKVRVDDAASGLASGTPDLVLSPSRWARYKEILRARLRRVAWFSAVLFATSLIFVALHICCVFSTRLYSTCLAAIVERLFVRCFEWWVVVFIVLFSFSAVGWGFVMSSFWGPVTIFSAIIVGLSLKIAADGEMPFAARSSLLAIEYLLLPVFAEIAIGFFMSRL